jgi:hypothetical protein
VFEDLNDPTRVMILWPATNALIVEEHMSTKEFEHLHCVKPFLIWVKGAFSPPEENSVVDQSDFTNLENLNDRNLGAISKAIDIRSIVVNADRQPSDLVSVLTIAEKDDCESVVVDNYHGHITNVVDVQEGAEVDNDGDEIITVHTAHTPGDVLDEEKKLVDYLSGLNNPKKGIKELPLKVGGHDVVVQTFHYPALNVEAPQNKRQRTYVNKDNMPILFSYEAKEVLTIYLNVTVGNGKLARKVDIS